MASTMLVGISCLLFGFTLTQVAAEISDNCMYCLCEAVAGGPSCVLGGTCHDGVCGPYSITYPYWQDGGRPTVGLDDRNSPKTYEKCALDTTCAEATVRGYMNKFQQDCNGDQVVDCWDYAAIHFHGGYGCNKPLSVLATNALRNCLGNEELPPENVQPSVPEENYDYDPNVLGVTTYQPPSTYPSIDIRLGGLDDTE